MALSEYSLPLPDFDAPVRVLLVVAPFYRDIANALIDGATGLLDTAGIAHDMVEVPGALEIPTAIRIADRDSNFDGFVALGCVIRGATTHYETVCNDSSRALTILGLEGLCIGNGILTVETAAQAEERADPSRMNKGAGAAAAALHLISLARRWRPAGRPRTEPGSYQIARK